MDAEYMTEEYLLGYAKKTGVADGWEEVFMADATFLFKSEDVEECLAAVVETGDYAETEVWALVRLKSGGYGYITGGCDTTGWDCQSIGSSAQASSLETLLPQIDDEGAWSLFGLPRGSATPKEG